MLYAVLCYNDEKAVSAWTKEEDDACMARLAQVQERWQAKGKLGPVARLRDTRTATTLRKSGANAMVVDGPFAETKEQFLGFYMVDCDTLEEAVDFAKELSVANPGVGSYEIRPVALYNPVANAVPAAAE